MAALKPIVTSFGQFGSLSSISACKVDSPKPNVCIRAILKLFEIGNNTFKEGIISSLSIWLNSLGTPGVHKIRHWFNIMLNPTALPVSLAIMSQPQGK